MNKKNKDKACASGNFITFVCGHHTNSKKFTKKTSKMERKTFNALINDLNNLHSILAAESNDSLLDRLKGLQSIEDTPRINELTREELLNEITRLELMHIAEELRISIEEEATNVVLVNTDTVHYPEQARYATYNSVTGTHTTWGGGL